MADRRCVSLARHDGAGHSRRLRGGCAWLRRRFRQSRQFKIEHHSGHYTRSRRIRYRATVTWAAAPTVSELSIGDNLTVRARSIRASRQTGLNFLPSDLPVRAGGAAWLPRRLCPPHSLVKLRPPPRLTSHGIALAEDPLLFLRPRTRRPSLICAWLFHLRHSMNDPDAHRKCGPPRRKRSRPVTRAACSPTSNQRDHAGRTARTTRASDMLQRPESSEPFMPRNASH